MPARGKHGKPTSGFPPFPPPLNIPQLRQDVHIPTAPTIRPYIKVRLKTPALKPHTWGWAKTNFRSGPSAVAKSSPLRRAQPAGTESCSCHPHRSMTASMSSTASLTGNFLRAAESDGKLLVVWSKYWNALKTKSQYDGAFP